MLFPRAVEIWIILCAGLAFAGWVFSALGVLGAPAYGCFFIIFAGVLLVIRQKSGLPRIEMGRELRKLRRRFKRFPAILYLCILIFSVIGALAYPTIHFDSLSYRLPRVLHWLAEGKWHWIHTPDVRMNVVATGTEWVWTPLMLLTDSERILAVTNLISFCFLPGLVYAFFIRVGVKRRPAWWWMWILPAGYCYALQAGSLATDGYATIFSLGAVVYAFKAVERKSCYFLWISILAVAFATGTKQTNLIVGPLWFLAILPGWRILLIRPWATAAVVIVALLASFLPNCLANIKYAGSWNGFRLEPQSPLWAIIGNAFALPLENLLPPFFPAAREWNAAMLKFVQTPFGSHFAGFEHLAALYRGPSENTCGLGLTTCLLLLSGLFYCGRRGANRADGDFLHRLVRAGILIAPWLLVLVFMASVTIAKSARYLAFFYPFLFAGILSLSGAPYRKRWWRVGAYVSILVTIVTIGLLRQRPIFPVRLTTSMVERFVSKSLGTRARSAFSFVGQVRAAIDGFHHALPPNTKVAGYIAEAGNLEGALWHPYGTRRVWRFSGEDSPEYIRGKGVEYVILEIDSLDRSGAGSIEKWLERYQGEIVYTHGMPLEPDLPADDTYLIRLKSQPSGRP